MSPEQDLADLGIDRPITRWKAVRQYIQETHREALKKIDAVLFKMLIAWRAGVNAEIAGRPEWIRAEDVTEAVRWVEMYYGR